MEKVRLRAILTPLGLFVLSAGAYWAVLMGVVPLGLDAPLIFAGIAGVTALGAVKIGAWAPALTAGSGALGFALAGLTVGGILSLGAQRSSSEQYSQRSVYWAIQSVCSIILGRESTALPRLSPRTRIRPT